MGGGSFENLVKVTDSILAEPEIVLILCCSEGLIWGSNSVGGDEVSWALAASF